MKIHIYIDSRKSNSLYCGSDKSHFNSAGLMLSGRDVEYFERNKDYHNQNFCSKCVKKYKARQL